VLVAVKKKALITEGSFQRGKEEGTVQGRRSKALCRNPANRQKRRNLQK
jgi:hypothetical protein